MGQIGVCCSLAYPQGEDYGTSDPNHPERCVISIGHKQKSCELK